MITVKELIEKLEKVENKDLPIHIVLNDIHKSAEYSTDNRLDLVGYNINNNKIEFNAEPQKWFAFISELKFHGYSIRIFESKDYNSLRSFHFNISDLDDENLNQLELKVIYDSIKDENREDNGKFDTAEKAEFEAKLYINNVLA